MTQVEMATADEVYALMQQSQDTHAVMSAQLSDEAIKGMEQAQNEDIEAMFKGMRKHTVAPALGLLESDMVTAPASYSLRRYCAPIISQGSVGSCTAHGVTYAVQMMYFIATGKQVDFSESYLWFRQGEQPNAWLSATTATKFYSVRNEFWGYYAKEGNPGWENAKVCAPKNARELSNLEQFKSELSQGKPVVFSFSANFSNFAPRGWVNPQKATVNGAHCVCAVEYFDDSRFPGGGYFTCANSWGPNSGDKGYIYFPYSYVLEGNYWCNFISYSSPSDMSFFGNVPPAPTPVPPAPHGHVVNIKANLIRTFNNAGDDNKLYYEFNWVLEGPDLNDVKSWEEKLKYSFPRGVKPIRAVDMSKESKDYIQTYANNFLAGDIAVTFTDGHVVNVPLVFPKV